MRGFFECFRLEDADPEWETFDWGSSWTLCMLLWTRFTHDATLDQNLRDKWLHATTHNPNQDQLLSILTECLLHSGTTHPRWSPAESCECRRPKLAQKPQTRLLWRRRRKRMLLKNQWKN